MRDLPEPVTGAPVPAGMAPPPPRGLRSRLSAKLRETVRIWVEGVQVQHFDGRGHELVEWDYPSYPVMRVLETVPHDGLPVRVGKYCAFNDSAVVIPGGLHHSDWVGTAHLHVENGVWVQAPGAIHDAGQVVIGNDVLVAFEAVILSGVTIGDGAIIATRAVVTDDVEPYSMVAGNPARHIKYRFDEPTRAALLRIRWWDWDVEKVAAHKEQIHSPHVAEFIAGHDPELGAPSCPICRTGGG